MQEIEPASAYQYFLAGEYVEAARLYEALIASASTERENYWYLGLTYLLQGNQEEAQLSWLLALSQAEAEEVDLWNKELLQVLKTEAQHQESLQNFQQSWLTRQAIRELAPTDIDNVLHLLELSISLKTFTASVLAEWQVVEILARSAPENINSDLLLQVIQKILALPVINSEIVELLKAALPHIVRSDSLVQTLLIIALKVRYEALEYKLAVELLELCSILAPDELLILRHLSCLYTDACRYDKGIEVAKQFYEGCDTPALKAVGGYLLLRALLSAGRYWQEVWAVKETQESVLAELIAEQPRDLERGLAISLIFATSFFPYLQDKLEVNRYFQNQVAKIVQANLRKCAGHNEDLALTALIRDTRKISRGKVLKIGYIGHTLRKHSVGWLSRWLFKYHNRNAFQIYLYLNFQKIDEFTQKWFVDRVDGCWVGSERDAIAKQILNDEIDILVDLDSNTLDSTCEIMALKPAPIQVTWLGTDASGIPAIDYFIADAYVLPDNAQNYYQEKIWRLPNAYVAVDGFEIGVPTVRREALEIPPEAVVYFSSQTGQKRHPQTARLQLKILKQVPNSYFLIKSLGDRAVIEQMFTQLALCEEVEPERLRFLPAVADSLEHRANLGIADVVLDTYPYNGATTTLETLWMGIPLVTRVGEQFAARNSYTFLMNAGVTEGIAWTDEEYVGWGIRLGQDLGLRQQVSQKLEASRQTAPLWNAKQFTQEMEKAYQQMWQIYLNNNFP